MKLLSTHKSLVLASFVAVTALGLLGLLSQTTLFTGSGLYHVTVTVPDADNMVPGAQVRMAGVTVGNVLDVMSTPGGAVATVALGDRFAPLHEGVTIRVGNRSLVEETYLDVKDGGGPEIPDGTTLPATVVRTSTQIRDLLESLDVKTRASVASLLQSTDPATAGTRVQVNQLFTGLGDIGRDGGNALQAAAAQSDDLKRLAEDTTTMLTALDTGRGEIASMVENANRLTEATAQQRPAIEATMTRLPGVLDSARTAGSSLRDLAHSLGPVAEKLKNAAPQLSDALHDLPQVSSDLWGLMPDLNRALDRTPGTLDRIGPFSENMRHDIIPNARDILQDANPMLAFMKDYGPDVAGLIANFGAVLGYQDEAGRQVFHATVTASSNAVASPVNPGNMGNMDYYNPIPDAGTLRNPGPFRGPYPRLNRQPR